MELDALIEDPDIGREAAARGWEDGLTVQRPDGGNGADLFISLHHNAHSKPEANYTTVWFHGEADWSEPDLDAARYIAQALFRNLRTDVIDLIALRFSTLNGLMVRGHAQQYA